MSHPTLTRRHLCIKCLIDDGFFNGGGSWAPDSCPKCGGTHCIMYEALPNFMQLEAKIINDILWDERWKKEKT